MWENCELMKTMTMDGIERANRWRSRRGKTRNTRWRISSDVIFPCFSFELTRARLAFNSFVWTNRSESVAIGIRRSIAWDRRCRSLFIFVNYLSFAQCTLRAPMHRRNSKAPHQRLTTSNPNEYNNHWSAFECVAFKSLRSVHSKVNIILILEEFQIDWFSLRHVSFSSLPNKRSNVVERVRVCTICRHWCRDKWTTFVCSFVRSFEVKWHSIELFRLIKTFAQMALGWSMRITRMCAAAAAAVTFLQCVVSHAI